MIRKLLLLFLLLNINNLFAEVVLADHVYDTVSTTAVGLPYQTDQVNLLGPDARPGDVHYSYNLCQKYKVVRTKTPIYKTKLYYYRDSGGKHYCSKATYEGTKAAINAGTASGVSVGTEYSAPYKGSAETLPVETPII